MHLTTSDGVQLFFDSYGERENAPIVLVHGLGADHRMWKPQIVTFPSHDLYTIVPDIRCHGRSSCGGSFCIEECARDIAELLDHLNLTTAHLVGVGMGGLIAQQFACDCSDRVDRLVVCDSFSEVSSWWAKSSEWMRFMLLKLAPRLFAKSWRLAYGGTERAEARAYYTSVFAEQDISNLRNAAAAVDRFKISDRLHEILVPTLVLVGDQLGRSRIKMAEETAQGIPSAQFQILEGGYEPSNLIAPEIFDHAILDFIP